MGRHRREKQFLAVYDAYQDAIFRHCYFRIFNRERAKELSQEAFMRIWERLAAGDSIDNIKAFVYRVANNLIIDEKRKKTQESLDALRENGFEPSENGKKRIEMGVDVTLLLEKSMSMEEKHREVLLFRYIDNLKPKEIAEILGETQNVISVRIHRAVKELQEIVSR